MGIAKFSIWIFLTCVSQCDSVRQSMKLGARGVISKASAGEDAPMNGEVEILFVRHGHGCHNAVHHQPAKNVPHCTYPDPPLTECGIFLTHCNGQKLREDLKRLNTGFDKPDFVGSSAMIRAIETARILFPDEVVHPLPFIKELVNGLAGLGNVGMAILGKDVDLADCNKVSSISHQKKYFRSTEWDSLTGQPPPFSAAGKRKMMSAPAAAPGKAVGNIDFKHVDEKAVGSPWASWKNNTWNIQNGNWSMFSGAKSWTSAKARSGTFFKGFMQYIAEVVVPSFPGEVLKKGKLKLVIVSHSNYLSEKMEKYFFSKSWNCGKKDKRPLTGKKWKSDSIYYFANNQAILFKFDYSGGKLKPAQKATKVCSDVQKGSKKAKDCCTPHKKKWAGETWGQYWHSKTASWDEDYLCSGDFAKCYTVEDPKNRAGRRYMEDENGTAVVNVQGSSGDSCCVKSSCDALTYA